MKKRWKYIIVLIVGGLIGYNLTIHLMPNVIYAGAKKKILDRTNQGLNKVVISPIIDASFRAVVMPNPDFMYMTAFYDLKDGPLKLTGNMPDSTYWSVSMYYPNTVNWFIKNDMQFSSNDLDLLIKHSHEPSVSSTDLAISEQKEGFLLFRVLITNRTEEKIKSYQGLLKSVRLEKVQI